MITKLELTFVLISSTVSGLNIIFSQGCFFSGSALLLCISLIDIQQPSGKERRPKFLWVEA